MQPLRYSQAVEKSRAYLSLTLDLSEPIEIEDFARMFKALALTYGSQMAEERVRHEIRDDEYNVYKKGFVVDVNVQKRNGKPVAYSVTHVHQIVVLPDD